MKTASPFVAVLCASLALSSGSAIADPRRGEFAGHRLTSKISISKPDAKSFLTNGLIRVRTNTTPDLKDFEYVDVIATPKSGTIVEIWAIRNFREPEDALTEFDSLAEVLKHLYRMACPLSKWEPGARASFLCDPPDRYVMTVEVTPGQDGTRTLRFGLQLDHLSEKLPSIQRTIRAEVDQEKAKESPYVARKSFE